MAKNAKVIAKKLSPEVAEKYRLKTIRPGKFNFEGYGTIDLRTMKIAKADELYEKGFPFLVLKEIKKPENTED